MVHKFYSTLLIGLLVCLASHTNAQVFLNELSGDATNNDSENDGIVELAAAPGTNIGCYVITNGEWVVVLPPNTVMPSDGVFSIACGQAVSPNPSPGSGIARTAGDFMPSLPIDFDVCDPINQYYVDWSATGFTIDNSNVNDGDQVVLFMPNGTVADAVQWGGGSTSSGDNNVVSTLATPYPITFPGTSNLINPLSSATQGVRPLALRSGGACFDTTISYIMPTIASGQYCNVTNLSALHPNQDGDVLTACNSSFQRTSLPASNSIADRCNMAQWRKSEHPNPGFPNLATIDSLLIPADDTIVQCGAVAIPVTLEVYNFAQVEPTILSADGKVGSIISIDGGASLPWTTIVPDTNTGITTLSYTVPPLALGTHTVSLVWDDLSNSAIASSSVGSSSPSGVAAGTQNSDCYQLRKLIVKVVAPLTATTKNLACPPANIGLINVKNSAGIAGGCIPTYTLFDNGVQVGTSNTTGIFNLPNTLGSPLTVLVTPGCSPTAPTPCDTSITITINNNCKIAPPPCPQFTSYDACATAAGAVCPNQTINLSLVGTNLPNGGNIEWVIDANNNDNVYDETDPANVIATQSISVTTSGAPTGTPVLNEVLYDATTETGSNYGEGWEIAGTPGTNIGCYYFTDGDFTVQLPAGTLIPADGFFVVGTSQASASWSANIDYLITSTSTIPNLTNGGEFLAMFSPTNTFVNGVIWGTPNASNSPSNTSSATMAGAGNIVAGAGCPALPTAAVIVGNINAANTAASFATVGSTGASGNEGSIELATDITGAWQQTIAPGNVPNSMGSSNQGGSSTTLLTPACATFVIPTNACSSAINIKPRINPVNLACTGTPTTTLATRTFTVTCPNAILSGNPTVCSGNPANVQIDFTGVPTTPAAAVPSTVTITLFKNGIMQVPLTVPYADPLTLDVATNYGAGEYTLSAISFAGATPPICSATLQGTSIVVVNPSPAVALSSTNVDICKGSTGQIPVVLTGNPPFTVTYNIDGGATQTTTLNSTVFNVDASTLTTGAHTINLLSVIDDALCPGTVSGTGNITVLNAPLPKLTSNGPVCYGVPSSATINITTIATGASSFAWTGPNSYTSVAQNPSISPATNLNSGLYNVEVTYTNSCKSSAQIYVEVTLNPSVTASASNICADNDLVLASSATLGGAPVSSFAWSGPASYAATTQNTTIAAATASATGTYSVSVTDAKGCTNTSTVAVNVYERPSVAASASNVCADADLSLTSTPSNGTGTVNAYAWSGPASYAAATQNTTISAAQAAASGVYTVTVTDDNTCTNTNTVSVTVYARP
ncbi:MAG: hypothetical protein RL660_2839, partial [Bacteroidota bacterium]